MWWLHKIRLIRSRHGLHTISAITQDPHGRIRVLREFDEPELCFDRPSSAAWETRADWAGTFSILDIYLTATGIEICFLFLNQFSINQIRRCLISISTPPQPQVRLHNDLLLCKLLCKFHSSQALELRTNNYTRLHKLPQLRFKVRRPVRTLPRMLPPLFDQRALINSVTNS